MILTKELAEKNIGKFIDCHKRILGYYPKQIIENSIGEIVLKDPLGVCTMIETGFNATHYDFITNQH